MSKKIVVLLLSSLAITFATLIQTIIINKIDGNLSDINEKILDHNNTTIVVMQIRSDAKQRFLVKRFNVLELNILKINYDSPVVRDLDIAILKEEIFTISKNIIKEWAGIFKEKEWRILEKDLNQIINNQGASFNDRLKKLDSIHNAEYKSSVGRFQNHLDKLEVYRSDKRKYKDERIFWSSWFISLQVLGLLLLVISQILAIPSKNESINMVKEV